jgi:hypothetical protein
MDHEFSDDMVLIDRDFVTKHPQIINDIALPTTTLVVDQPESVTVKSTPKFKKGDCIMKF